jgi:hypothetical protein
MPKSLLACVILQKSQIFGIVEVFYKYVKCIWQQNGRHIIRMWIFSQIGSYQFKQKQKLGWKIKDCYLLACDTHSGSWVPFCDYFGAVVCILWPVGHFWPLTLSWVAFGYWYCFTTSCGISANHLCLSGQQLKKFALSCFIEQSATTITREEFSMVKFAPPGDRQNPNTNICVTQEMKFALGKVQVILISMQNLYFVQNIF